MSDNKDGMFKVWYTPDGRLVCRWPSGATDTTPGKSGDVEAWIGYAYRLGREDGIKSNTVKFALDHGIIQQPFPAPPPTITITRKFIGGPLDGKEITLPESATTYIAQADFQHVTLTESGSQGCFRPKDLYKLGTVNGEPVMVYQRSGK
jgi:hypothetical protein